MTRPKSMATPVVPSAAIWLETRADTLLQLESYAVLPGPHIYITDGSSILCCNGSVRASEPLHIFNLGFDI
jgi:hypothetical protein